MNGIKVETRKLNVTLTQLISIGLQSINVLLHFEKKINFYI